MTTTTQVLMAIRNQVNPGFNHYAVVIFLGNIRTDGEGNTAQSIILDIVGPTRERPDELEFVNLAERYMRMPCVVYLLRGDLSRSPLFVHADKEAWELELIERTQNRL